MAGKSRLASKWLTKYGNGLELDKFGQLEEARDVYDQLAQSIDSEVEDTTKGYTQQEQTILHKLVMVLRLRANALRQGESDGVSVSNMQELVPVFEGLFDKPVAFPFELSRFGVEGMQSAAAAPEFHKEKEVVLSTPTSSTGGAGGAAADMPMPAATGTGRLLSPPPFREGMTYFDVTIDRIGFKDETLYIDPFVTITVVDALGHAVETSQETPVSNVRKRNYICFNSVVHLQTCETDLPPECAVFFEFRHFKPKKKKISTKCYAFIERDELKPGAAACELYLKPTDFTRKKKLRLMTVKPLFLHLTITQRKD